MTSPHSLHHAAHPPSTAPTPRVLCCRYGLRLSCALLALTACSNAELPGQLPCLKAQLSHFSVKLVLSWHCAADSDPASTAARQTVPRLSAASR